MRRRVWCRELLGDQGREEVVILPAANDPGLGQVLTPHADAGMDEHSLEKSRLPLGKSELRDGPNVVGRVMEGAPRRGGRPPAPASADPSHPPNALLRRGSA